MKTKVAIFGGAFDPPHLGHVAAAIAVADHVDEVWMVPCYGHLFNKKMTLGTERLGLCRETFLERNPTRSEQVQRYCQGLRPHECAEAIPRPHPRVKIDSAELRWEHKTGTYASLLRFQKENEHCEFYFVIGQDNADKIENFRNYQKLISEFPAIVLPRKGHEVKDGWYCQAPHLYLKDVDLPEISSSYIRKAFSSKHPEVDYKLAESFVTPTVYEYCIEHNLYGNYHE